jgi:hypothetical protein
MPKRSKEGFYKYYLECLEKAAKCCGNNCDIQTAEMILFANAEILAESLLSK